MFANFRAKNTDAQHRDEGEMVALTFFGVIAPLKE